MDRSTPIDEVLLVDDDVISLMTQEQVLEGFGVARKITAIEDGEQAIDFIQKNWITDAPTEEKVKSKKLLLLDLRMPNMSGMEFLEQFARLDHTDGIAIVVLSAIVPEFIKQNSAAFNVIAYFDKPLTREKVEQIMHKL